MNWFVDDYSRTQILITDGVREFYIPKFRLAMDIDGDVVYLYWNDRERGTGGDERILPLNYLDVVDNYSGYISNPTSATDLASQIDAMIDSAWTDITAGGGDLLTAKGDLLSHDSVSDTILPAGTNEYILSRDNTTQTGLKWIPKTDIYSNANAVAAVGSFSYVIGYSGNVDAPNAASTILYTCTIPANTLSVGDSIRATYAFKHSTGSGSTGFIVYLNNVNTLVGATAYQTIGITGTLIWQCEAHILMSGASAQTGVINNGAIYQTAGGDRTTSAYSIASDMYLMFVCTKATITDGAHLRWAKVIVEKYRT